jgi:serine protease AprX
LKPYNAMKKLMTLLLFSSLSFGQNEMEREKIRQASNPEEVSRLKQMYVEYFEEQSKLIDAYHTKNNSTAKDRFALQRIIDGIPFFYTTDNAGSVATLRADSMYPGGSLGLNVTGQGITIGIWDGGKVRNTHQEFVGRITLGDGAATNNGHATHVAGTAFASGVSATRKGFAYQASGRTYDWTSDASEMITFGDSGFLVSNHSYGNIAGNLPIEQFGMYNSQSIEVDNIMNAFPYYQVVKSAGNDRDNNSITQVLLDGGYDLLTGVSCAKNVLTVAAVNQVTNYTSPSSVQMSSFSNFGPTDDGRIKPDISAKGTSVSSTNSVTDASYNVLQGTSMSAPAITGLIALLQKHYNNLNPTTFMKSASVRGLICHSAREAGEEVGPDYGFGWGLADGLNAAQVISSKGTTGILDERSLENGATYTASFTINSSQDINVTICWTDPTGSANISSNNDDRSPRLRNNLDLKVIKDGTIYYPWKLNPDEAYAPATNNSDNNVDNVERVQVFNATPGTYTIQVNHKGTLQNGSQDYTLIASTTNGLTLNNEDFIADNSFFVYPNPVNEQLYFSNPNNYELSSLSVSDITGKQIMSMDMAQGLDSINVSNLQSGVYFVKFTTNDNSVVKKFIKK